MSDVIPPWYKEFILLVNDSDLNQVLKKELALYIHHFGLKLSSIVNVEKEKKYLEILRKLTQLELIKDYNNCISFLGKAQDGEKLDPDEIEKYRRFLKKLHLWKICVEWEERTINDNPQK